jgi:hypothetical protein
MVFLQLSLKNRSDTMRSMMILYLLLLTSLGCAQLDLYPRAEPKISVQNKILAKVNGNVISVVDVMKKMDLLMHQNYPQYAESAPARYQFYMSSWRSIFMEMVDTELILSDAQDKEIKLTDGDVREEMERRFGPNILQTLESMHLTYDDTWKMVRKDLIMQRMLWYFVHSKALSEVSPEAIRNAYRSYLEAHPPYQELTYRVLSIRGADPHAVLQLCMERGLDALSEIYPTEVQVSNEYTVKQTDLSISYRDALNSLTPGSFSPPIINKAAARIFYLVDRQDHPAPTFEVLAPKLKNELQQKAVAKESMLYLNKLRKHYGFDPSHLEASLSDDFQPFTIQ